MYIWALLSKTWVGWVGGSVLGTPCTKLVTTQKPLTFESWGDEINSKVIWRGVVVGGVIWLHLRISRAKWKHFMIDKTHKFVIENHTIHLQMEAFYMIDKTHKFVNKNRMIPLTPTHMPWLTPE